MFVITKKCVKMNWREKYAIKRLYSKGFKKSLCSWCN